MAKYWITRAPGQPITTGVQIVAHRLRADGHAVDDADNGGVPLLSAYWLDQVALWLRTTPPDVARRTVAGGQTAWGNPGCLLGAVAGVYCGDGECWDGALDHPSVARRNGPPAMPALNDCVPQVVVQSQTGLRQHDWVPSVELTRGCRNHCAYCQYSWLRPWRAAETGGRHTRVVRGMHRRARIITVDGAAHDDWDAVKTGGRHALQQDVTLSSLRDLLAGGGVVPRQIRLGIDGMSSRIRRALGRSVWHADDVVAILAAAVEAGVSRIVAYQIYGAPGETADDWREWVDTVRRTCDAATRGRCAWMTVWSRLLPMPQTPLQWAPAAGADARSHDDARALAAAGRRVVPRTMIWGVSDDAYWRRLLVARATPECVDLIRQSHTMTASQIERAYRAITGHDLAGRVDDDPWWDGYVWYPRPVLARWAARYDVADVAPRRSTPIAGGRLRCHWDNVTPVAWQPTLF